MLEGIFGLSTYIIRWLVGTAVKHTSGTAGGGAQKTSKAAYAAPDADVGKAMSTQMCGISRLTFQLSPDDCDALGFPRDLWPGFIPCKADI